jgi:5-methylcytosine-specific restriction endonuclease McrA
MSFHNYRARRQGVPGTISRTEWFTFCFAVGFRCAVCGKIAHMTMDHIIPMWRGGPNWLWNTQPLCISCHREKTAEEEYDTRTAEEVLGDLFRNELLWGPARG